MRSRRNEDLSLHAGALFGAISLAIAPLGCGNKTSPEAVPVTAEPQASAAPPAVAPAAVTASASAEASAAAPSVSASAAPEPLASASAEPSGRPGAAGTPPPSRVQRPKPHPSPRPTEGRPFLVDDTARVA